MARQPRKSPGVGHNSDALPDESAYRLGLAMFVLMTEEMDKLKERQKRLKKRTIEGAGIAIDDVKTMYSMRDQSLPEVVHWLKRKMHSLGSMLGVKFQLDFFKPNLEASEALKFKGMLSGCAGEPCSPPTTLDNEERNLWIEGHGLGADSRNQAQSEMSKEFTDGKDGDFSEGALKGRAAAKANKAKAKAIGLQAAQDFKDDQGGPTEEEKTFASQSEKADALRAEAGVG